MGDSQPKSIYPRTFTGADVCFPVELFIASIENEFSKEPEQFRVAMDRISSHENSPAGKWKSNNSDFSQKVTTN